MGKWVLAGLGVHTLQVVETLKAGPLNLVSGVNDLKRVVQGGPTLLYSATRAGGGILALDADGAMVVVDQKQLAPGAVLPAPATLDILSIHALAALTIVATATGAVRLNLQAPAQNTGIAAGQTYRSIEQVIGSGFSDQLTGDSFANRREGGDGGDQIVGSGGDDALFEGAETDNLNGGSGADTRVGGAGRVRATYRQSGSGVLVDPATTPANIGQAAGDVYLGVAEVEGSNLNDTVFGDAQAKDIDALLAGALSSTTGLSLIRPNGDRLDISGLFAPSLPADDIVFL